MIATSAVATESPATNPKANEATAPGRYGRSAGEYLKTTAKVL